MDNIAKRPYIKCKFVCLVKALQFLLSVCKEKESYDDLYKSFIELKKLLLKIKFQEVINHLVQTKESYISKLILGANSLSFVDAYSS